MREETTSKTSESVICRHFFGSLDRLVWGKCLWCVNDEIYGDDLVILMRLRRKPDKKTPKEIQSSSVYLNYSEIYLNGKNP